MAPVRARMASRSVVLPLEKGPTMAMHFGPVRRPPARFPMLTSTRVCKVWPAEPAVLADRTRFAAAGLRPSRAVLDLLTCIVPWLGAAGKRNRTETRAAPGPTILSQVALEATMSVAIWRQANIRGRHIQDKRYRLQSGGTIAMSTELDHLSRLVAKGKLSRRDFLGRASALGVGALAANTLLARAASA